MHTIQGLSTGLRNDVGEKKFTVHKVCYSEKSDMPRSEMRVSAIVIIIKLTIKNYKYSIPHRSVECEVVGLLHIWLGVFIIWLNAKNLFL